MQAGAFTCAVTDVADFKVLPDGAGRTRSSVMVGEIDEVVVVFQLVGKLVLECSSLFAGAVAEVRAVDLLDFKAKSRRSGSLRIAIAGLRCARGKVIRPVMTTVTAGSA